MRSYAIGDVHGQRDRLAEAHRRIAEDRRLTGDDEAPVIHLGDLVDRGPDSAGVVAFVAEGMAAGRPWRMVKGNHDRLCTGFLADPAWQDPGLRAELNWLDAPLGGRATLASYGVDVGEGRDLAAIHADAVARVPEAHRAFLAAQPCWIARGEAVFVHAGIRPGVPLDNQTDEDMLWIRDEFLSCDDDFGKVIVHGHTITWEPEVKSNRIGIDTGAFASGVLTAIGLEDEERWFLQS